MIPSQPNVVIDKLGHARLADFGLASISDESLWSPSNLRKTARWMSPELLNTDPAVAEPTTASDIYAFAMVVIEVIPLDAPSFKVSPLF